MSIDTVLLFCKLIMFATTYVALATCDRCTWHDCLRLCIARSGSLILVFETTLNVPVIDICTPVFAWGTATLFANGNAVFQLFGFRARRCARCLFLGNFAFAFTFVRPSWTDVSSINVDACREFISSDVICR